ncbi:MAG TPA: family 20 glycosylhydrolase [Sphingobacteriaceae bacterium]
MFKRIAFVLAFILIWFQGYTQISVIPQPTEVTLQSKVDSFSITPKTVLVINNSSLQPSVDFFNLYLQEVSGFTLKVSTRETGDNSIFLTSQNNIHGESGSYTLDVTKKGVTITGKDGSGVFYGMQTLLQLLPVKKASVLNIPLVKVNDSPRYQYRGMMLDVSRHFFPVEFVKKFIDYLALHKINYFHWHLTEDQGWRIEIKKYPKLTQVGAYRDGTIIGHYPGTGNDGKRYGGYYTQKQVKGIVAYADKRYITVVPEIEMPGHSSAALAAYPYLGCTGGPYQVRQTWGVSKDVYCAGNDSVFVFLENVLDEVTALFPSKYIHIGGDESPKDRWKVCPKCKKRISNQNLKDEHELQSYFIQRIEKHLNSKGRTLIGWDEILEGGLAPNAVVMSWRGEKGGIEATKQKHPVIMTPSSHLYFDQFQGKRSVEPLAIGGYLTLEKVYSYNPTPSVLTTEEAKYIKGVQANLWTEYIKSPEHAEYMIMPRLSALSEVGWTEPQQKNWTDFKRRMEKQYQRYEALDVNYAKTVFNVKQTIVIETERTLATVTLETDSFEPMIYYTLDGSEPTINSLRYTKPFTVNKSTTIKAANLKDGQPVGKTSEQQVIIN